MATRAPATVQARAPIWRRPRRTGIVVASVGGGLLAVAPGRLAVAAFSSRLNPAGNSVRGWAAVEDIANELGLGLFSGPRPPIEETS